MVPPPHGVGGLVKVDSGRPARGFWGLHRVKYDNSIVRIKVKGSSYTTCRSYGP